MLNYIDVQMHNIAIHRIGAPARDEQLMLSDHILHLPEGLLHEDIQRYFFSSFKEPNFYRFMPVARSLEDNVMHRWATEIFENPALLLERSRDIAKYLYDRSVHPNIKSGDLFVFYFEDVLLGDEIVSGMGVVKAEVKSTFLQVNYNHSPAEISRHLGIAVNKIDKACLIFNTERSDGYKLCVLDRSNKSEAHFWLNDFLQAEAVPDDYYQTKNYIEMTKSFVKERMEPLHETGVIEEVGVMNRAQDYFTVSDNFSDGAYADHVFPEKQLATEFLNYRQDYENEQGVSLQTDFDISAAAVQKQSKFFRSVLKLDKNFHIYIHGNREMIERGVDSEGRKFYKVFYENEA